MTASTVGSPLKLPVGRSSISGAASDRSSLTCSGGDSKRSVSTCWNPTSRQVESGSLTLTCDSLRRALSQFSDHAFDTVVLKETLHHLAAESDVEAALAEVARVCSQRVVILEPNPSIPLKVGRTLIGHVDPTLPVDSARSLLENAGFKVAPVDYFASIAFPLSGGYVAKPLLRRRPPRWLLRFDDRIVQLFGAAVAWRYLMVGDKKHDAGVSTGNAVDAVARRAR